jgi:hypothetical protein
MWSTTAPATQWCIYPMYDFAHPIEDALEGVTHSICTLEFEVHRPLYDWVIDRMDELGMLVVRNGVTDPPAAARVRPAGT